jgi:hypothetical protein
MELICGGKPTSEKIAKNSKENKFVKGRTWNENGSENEI